MLLVAAPVAGCGSSDDDNGAEPSAGEWKTWVQSSSAMDERTASEERAEREFGVDPPAAPWLQRAMSEGRRMGEKIGRLTVQRAKRDGAER